MEGNKPGTEHANITRACCRATGVQGREALVAPRLPAPSIRRPCATSDARMHKVRFFLTPTTKASTLFPEVGPVYETSFWSRFGTRLVPHVIGSASDERPSFRLAFGRGTGVSLATKGEPQP
jgi:hypothetical protein